MATWFSASAVVPQLRDEWELSRGAASWLTIAVQLGFVAGALVSSVLNVADVVAPHIVIFAGSAGAAAANALLLTTHGPAGAVPLRLATGFFLAGVYPPALKLMATWFRRSRGTALGILVGALTLGSALPHLVNGLGGLDWRVVIAATSALTLTGGVIALAVVIEGPYPFPRATFDPRQARLVFANRGVRLASLGYFGHMWELYAMWAWFLVFATDTLFASPTAAALTTFAVIGVGALGCVAGRRAQRPVRSRRDDRGHDGVLRLLRAGDRSPPHLGGNGGRTRVGIHGRRGLGAVLHTRDGIRRPGVRRHRSRAPARRRVHAHGRDDLADSRARKLDRVALGVCVPGAGPRDRRRGDDPVAFGTLLALVA